MPTAKPVFNEYDTLRSVLLCSPEVAFVNSERVKRLWQGLGYTGMPSLEKARAEHRRFAEILQRHNVETLWLEAESENLSLDAIYVHDAAVVVPGGLVLCRMGKWCIWCEQWETCHVWLLQSEMTLLNLFP